MLLANRLEVFRGGARLGDLCYDLAIAYVGAFLFYLLVVRIPLRQDRRNVYRHLAPLIGRVVGEARNLIGMLNEAAGFDSSRENTLTNVMETCRKIGPDSRANLLVPSTSEIQYSTVLDAIHFHMERARNVNREILEHSSFIASNVVSLVTAIENNGYFRIFENMYPMFKAGIVKNTDMSVLARYVFDYLLLVDRLDDYRHDFLPTTAASPHIWSRGASAAATRCR